MVHVHAARQRGLQVVQVTTAGGSFLGPRLLGLPSALLVIRDGDVSLLGHLLLLGCVGLRLLADGSAEANNLVKDHLAHILDIIDDLEVEVECCGACGLVGGVMPDVQVWVLESFLDGDTGGGVKGQHAVQQVQGVGVGVGEQTLEGDLWHEGQVAHVFLGAGGANAREGLLVWCTQIVQDLVQLVDIVTTLKEGTTA